MTIGDILRYKDINTYNKLMQLYKVREAKPKKEIKLGDNIENLMGHDSYSRSGGRIKQRRWG